MRLRFYRLAHRLLPHLPLALCYWLAEVAGDGLWLLDRGTRANVEHNQRRAWGPGATERQIAGSSRQALRLLTKIYVDEFRLPATSGETLRQAVTIHGLEHLDVALAGGKGAIVASAHYGAPHIVGHLFAVLGYPITVVVEHVQPEEIFQFMLELRGSLGTRLVPIDRPLLSLIRTLRKENGIVGLVCDRDTSGSGLRMPFLGAATTVADGPAQLALRTGAPIVVTYCRRRADNRYEAFVEPAFSLPAKPTDADAAIRDATRHLMSRLEAFIRAEPGQWVMTVPLWEREERRAESGERGAGDGGSAS